MDIRIIEGAKTNIGPTGNHVYPWKTIWKMKLWFRENKRIWIPTFTFESETWTNEIRKREDVEAEHVEVFRPLVGAS